jgi:hypothetical protein
MTVQQALSLLLAATLLPMLAGGAWILHAQWSGEREAANARLLSQAHTLVAATDQQFAAVAGRLQSAAASEQIDRADWAGRHRYARRALADWPDTRTGRTSWRGGWPRSNVRPWRRAKTGCAASSTTSSSSSACSTPRAA